MLKNQIFWFCSIRRRIKKVRGACEMKKIPLWQQLIIGGILGIVLGVLNQQYAVQAKILGDIFINMIKMTIVPLVFPLIVIGIAKMKSGKALSFLTLKTMLYFEIVTTIILIMSVSLANLFQIGVGVNLAEHELANVGNLPEKMLDFHAFILQIVPANIFKAFAEQNMLSVLFFGIFFGIGLRAVGEKGKIVVQFLNSLSAVMFKILEYVIAFSPIGVFGFLAFSIATYGWEKIASLADLVLLIYGGCAIVVFVIFPIIAKFFGIPYKRLLIKIKDLLLIAASTRSSEAVLSPLMERLEKSGASNSVVSFVLPLGYSFNLDGGSVYWAPAILYIANVFNVPLDFGQQVLLIITIMILSKGVAGVSGGMLICLTTVASIFNLPLEGIALIMSVDFISDIARTVVNVIGNALATLVMAKSEHEFNLQVFMREQGKQTQEDLVVSVSQPEK